MFERFTDNARKVMALANQEAQRFNHEYIGTEHILLGLVKNTDCNAAKFLADFRIDLRNVRIEVERRITPGPDFVTMGKLPQTPEAKSLIEKAIAHARDRGDRHVGSEHLLLAVLSLPDTIAFQVLRELADPPVLHAAVTRWLDERAALNGTTPQNRGAAPTPPYPTAREYLLFLGATHLAARHPAPLTPDQIDQCLTDAIAILDRLSQRRPQQ